MKILIIRYSSLGDVLLTTPLLRALKEQLNATIHMLIKEEYVGVIEQNPYIDRIIIHNKFKIENLKRESYDCIVDLQNNFRSLIIKKRLGTKNYTVDKGRINKWLFLKFGIDRMKGNHVVDEYFQSVRTLGINKDDKGLDFILTQDYPHDLEKLKGSICIILGGSYQTKRIPIKLVNDLTNKSNAHFVLLGGSDVVTRDIQERENVTNLINKTSINQSGNVINHAALVISGDTGMMHIAAALQKPLIVVWGSTAPVFGFDPFYGSKSRQIYRSVEIMNLTCRPCSKYGRTSCPKGHMNCLNSIKSEDIIKEIDRII